MAAVKPCKMCGILTSREDGYDTNSCAEVGEALRESQKSGISPLCAKFRDWGDFVAMGMLISFLVWVAVYIARNPGR